VTSINATDGPHRRCGFGMSQRRTRHHVSKIAFRVGNDRNKVVVADFARWVVSFLRRGSIPDPVSVHITLGYRSQPFLEVSWRKEERTISVKGCHFYSLAADHHRPQLHFFGLLRKVGTNRTTMGNVVAAKKNNLEREGSTTADHHGRKKKKTNSNCCFAQTLSVATTRRPPIFQEMKDDDSDDDEHDLPPPNGIGSSSSASCLLQRSKSSSSSSSYSKLLFANNNNTKQCNISSASHYTEDELLLSADEPTIESDLTQGRPVWIVTTAALPWMTGTAVNPLLRAAYLASSASAAVWPSHRADDDDDDERKQQNDAPRNQQSVHLVLPWLERAEDRVALYGEDWRDVDVDFQEAYIRKWVQANVCESSNSSIRMHWYPARYHAALGSIFAMGDVCATLVTALADDDNDDKSTTTDLSNAICLLEEPEHLNYYRGGHWRTHFSHVCGIIHTNYEAYAEQKSTLAARLARSVPGWSALTATRSFI
jgi:hypothetical protein